MKELALPSRQNDTNSTWVLKSRASFLRRNFLLKWAEENIKGKVKQQGKPLLPIFNIS